MNDDETVDITDESIKALFEIPEEYIHRVCEAFQMKDFYASDHQIYDKEEQFLGKIWVDYIWIVSVRSAEFGKFLLAVSQIHPVEDHSKKALKTLLIIPEQTSNHQNLYYEVIELEDDPVKDALEQTPLIHLKHEVNPEARDDNPFFNLYAVSSYAKVKFSYFAMGERKTMSQLWRAILGVLAEVRKIYNNPEIEAYFDANKDFYNRYY